MRRVLVTNLMMQRDIHLFTGQLQTQEIELQTYPVRQFLTEEELLPIVGDYDGMIAGDDQLTARVLEASQPRLKVISKWGVGLDAIDLKAAERLGIQVFNSPGAFGDAVAEVCLGYLLMLGQHLHRIDSEVRRGNWIKPEGEGLLNKTLGIVGLGAIGSGIARRAMPFGMRMLAYDVRMAEMTAPEGVEFVDLEQLLAEADYLCLACNLTPENRRMINADALDRMKPTACLVNVGRGSLVDEPALIAALELGKIAGAALDVYETEPLPPGHILTTLPNVILGSHNASNHRSSNEAVNRNSIRNLLRGFGIEEDTDL
jgi:D-3-phosphoglycerate dehydrogenase